MVTCFFLYTSDNKDNNKIVQCNLRTGQITGGQCVVGKIWASAAGSSRHVGNPSVSIQPVRTLVGRIQENPDVISQKYPFSWGSRPRVIHGPLKLRPNGAIQIYYYYYY